MPRESVRPEMHADRSDVGASPGDEGFVPHPTVEVGWTKDHNSLQLGLETPSWRGLRYDGSSGQLSLVDHLYGEHAEQIGDDLTEKLAAAGWVIAPDPDAPPQQSLEPDALGRIVLDAVTATSVGWTGWYTHLTRDGANRLITLLRKGRDATFGKDA